MKADEDRIGGDFLVQRQLLVTHSADAFGLANATAELLHGRWWLRLTFFPTDRHPDIDATHVRVLDPDGKQSSHLQPRKPPRSATAQRLASGKRARATADFLLAAEGDDARRLEIDTTPYVVELLDVDHLDPFFSRAPLRFARVESSMVSEVAETAEALRLQVAADKPPPEDIDYLAKDYESFRTLMLDHMARSVPQWTERNPADLGVTIIEALAYSADYLSYYQDAVGTEAYLETARRRISVRRHGVLLDYMLSEGMTPRAWIFVEISEAEAGPCDQPIWLPQGAQFLADSARKGVMPYPSLDYDRALRDGAEAFETLYGQLLHPSLNRLSIYPWRVADYELAAGATKATLEGDFTHRLRAGDVLLFEQFDGQHERRVELSKRQVVRLCTDSHQTRDPLDPGRALTEIEWHPEDALPFALPVRRHGHPRALAVVRGNVVLADIGRTTSELLPPVPFERPYRPRLDVVGERYRLVYHQPFILEHALKKPASAAAVQEEENLLPALTLIQLDESSWAEQGTVIDPADSRRWSPSRDLIRSGRFERSFVVETENDGTVLLRFGDGSSGLRPEPGSAFWSFYRVADLKTSPIGPGTGACLVVAGTTGDGDGPPLMPPDLQVRVKSASFPVGAIGGAVPETDEHARLFAPALVTKQERAVTAEDFAHRARRLDQVRDAWASLQWGGSWTLATLRVQRVGGRPVDEAFLQMVEQAFEGRLVMGYQLTVEPPCWVPLDIALSVRLEAHVDRQYVERQLHRRLGTGLLENGSPAFFYPDAFSFGQDVELESLVATALAVNGVLDVEVTRFRPMAAATGDELKTGQIKIAPDQVAEYGTLDFLWMARA